jgi:hypothetical protein
MRPPNKTLGITANGVIWAADIILSKILLIK